jgi:formylglycine-generating enzyme required for sulfatase activity
MVPHYPATRPRRTSKAAILSLVALVGASAAGAASSERAPGAEQVLLGAADLTLVPIPAGTFRMGTDQVITDGAGWTNDAERPVHEVRITRAFWLGEVPVTQGQWQAVMGSNPSIVPSAGPDAPAENVSWDDAQAFIAKLNGMQARWTFRLPTEAEWEYACRAGTKGETYGPLVEIGWYGENGERTTHPVAEKQPNGFGLYDMLGNVWQWCADWFGPYTAVRATDPAGPPTGERRITRGGCFYCDAIHCRAARRNRDTADHRSKSVGFRVAAVPRAPK